MPLIEHTFFVIPNTRPQSLGQKSLLEALLCEGQAQIDVGSRHTKWKSDTGRHYGKCVRNIVRRSALTMTLKICVHIRKQCQKHVPCVHTLWHFVPTFSVRTKIPKWQSVMELLSFGHQKGQIQAYSVLLINIWQSLQGHSSVSSLDVQLKMTVDNELLILNFLKILPDLLFLLAFSTINTHGLWVVFVGLL